MRRENRRRRPRARRLLSRNTPADSTGSPRCGKSLRSPHRQVYIVVRLFGVPFIRKSTALCPECPDVSHVGSTYFWRCACGTTLVPCRRWSCGRARRRVWRRFHFDALRMLVSDAEVASSIAPSLNRILQCALNTDEDDVAVPASSSDVHLCRLGVCPPPKKKTFHRHHLFLILGFISEYPYCDFDNYIHSRQSTAPDISLSLSSSNRILLPLTLHCTRPHAFVIFVDV